MGTIVKGLKTIAQYVKEFKCPQCKAYALYVDDYEYPTTVYCRKCPWKCPIADFAKNHMNYQATGKTASIDIPDIYGGEPQRVEFPAN
jgi:hypothetical protein